MTPFKQFGTVKDPVSSTFLIRGQDPRLQLRGGGHKFERAARRVETLDGVVVEGAHLFELLVLGVRQPRDEGVEVVRRVTGHGVDLAVVGIHDDGRPVQRFGHLARDGVDGVAVRQDLALEVVVELLFEGRIDVETTESPTTGSVVLMAPRTLPRELTSKVVVP